MQEICGRLEDHFFNPRNSGRLKDADAAGEAGSLEAGDAIRIFLRIDAVSDVVIAARFLAYGCPAVIACGSALTEIVTGRTVDEVRAITAADLSAFLGGLPDERLYCAVTAHAALMGAISHFRGETVPGGSLCRCFSVKGRTIERTVRDAGLKRPEDITRLTRAGGRCGSCRRAIEGQLGRTHAAMARDGLIGDDEIYIPSYAARLEPSRLTPQAGGLQPRGDAPALPTHFRRPGAQPEASPAAENGMTILKKVRLIERAVEESRPTLKAHGGDCELVDVDGDSVYVRLSGNCTGCQIASLTINNVRQKLLDITGLPLNVVPVD